MAAPGLTDVKGASSARTPLLRRGGEGSPLFQDVMDRVAEACVPPFEKLAGQNMSVTCCVASTTQETAAEAIAAGSAMITALFEVPALDQRLSVSLEDNFLQFFLELMCGGTCAEMPSETPRPGTSIDRQFARLAFNALSVTFARECAGFGLASLTFGQIQAKPDPGALGRREATVTLVTFALECLGREGRFHVAFPQAVLERFKQDALPAAKPAASADPEWSGRLHAEISRTSVSLDAFLDADRLTLGQVAALRPGQILTLPKTAPSRCELRYDDKLLFRCQLGQAEGRYSLRIDEGLPRPQAKSLMPAEAGNLLSD